MNKPEPIEIFNLYSDRVCLAVHECLLVFLFFKFFFTRRRGVNAQALLVMR
jgi:hypothetical protein